jgi:hypothetical protein
MYRKRLSRREFLKACTLATGWALMAPDAINRYKDRRDSTMAEIQIVEVVAKPLPEKVFQTEKFGISRKTTRNTTSSIRAM